MDRDGTVNREDGLVCREDQLVLLPGAAAAIRRLNDAAILAILVTNQPVVARNLCTENNVRRINSFLEAMLREAAGARLDGVYFCPHHPETHHPDGNPAYRIACTCRKPGLGMLEQARQAFGLDYAKCFLVGDTTRDIQTGLNAGCRTILVRTGHGGQDGKFDARPESTAADLTEAVEIVLKAHAAPAPPPG